MFLCDKLCHVFLLYIVSFCYCSAACEDIINNKPLELVDSCDEVGTGNSNKKNNKKHTKTYSIPTITCWSVLGLGIGGAGVFVLHNRYGKQAKVNSEPDFVEVASKVQALVKKYPEDYAQSLHINSGDRIVLIGDIHGDYVHLAQMFNNFQAVGLLQQDGTVSAPNIYFIFLGDYGTTYFDSNNKSGQVLTRLLQFKLLNNNNVFLLRGNWEYDFGDPYGDLWYRYSSGMSDAARKMSDELWISIRKCLVSVLYLQHGSDVVIVSHGAGVLDQDKDYNRDEPSVIDGYIGIPTGLSQLNMLWPISKRLSYEYSFSDFSTQKIGSRVNYTQETVNAYIDAFNKSLAPQFILRAFFAGHMHYGAPLKLFTKDVIAPDLDLETVGMASWKRFVSDKTQFTTGQILQNKTCPVFIFNATNACLYDTNKGDYKDQTAEKDNKYGFSYTIITIADKWEDWLMMPIYGAI